MKHLIWLGLALGLGCAGGEFTTDDEPSSDEGIDQQPLSTKFSATRTFGVGGGPLRPSCTVANGGGLKPGGLLYENCYLPGTKSITYRVSGTDPFECPGAGCSTPWNKSWKGELATAIWRTDLAIDAAVPGNGWAATQVALAPSTVLVTTGTCSGDADTSTNIGTFVCTSFPAGTSVTESLAGGPYKRWDTGAQITVDLAKIDRRAMLDIPCSGSGQASYHQLLEHGMTAAWWQIMGGGTRKDSGKWNDSNVDIPQNVGQGNGCLNSDNLSAGDVCRVANYSSSSPTTFSQASGSCAD
jgi:hypothetical protein